MIAISDLPALNASLNLTSALLLAVGYYFIRHRMIRAHRLAMVSAFVASTVFLTSYLVYHYYVGNVLFNGHGWIRPVYFFILITHVILAVAILPLVLRTLYLALRSRFDQHRRIARWTFPIWMYVSVTGVIVYLMLYRM